VKFLPSTRARPDDNIGRGVEFMLVVLVFLGLGYLLDRLFDTKPIFMIALFLFGMAGEMVKVWLGYDAKMRQHEADRAAARAATQRPQPAPPAKPAPTRTVRP
jgi:ATP synthase protein I